MKYRLPFLITLSILCFQVKGQVIPLQGTGLNDEEYKVINDLYGNKESEILIFPITDFSKTWSYLMEPALLDNLYGPPCNNGKEIIEWENIFSLDVFGIIRDSIIRMTPHKLNQTKLSENINLVNSYDNAEVTFISKPIIMNGFAIIKQSNHSNELIIIAAIQQGKWEPICRKWLVLTIDD